jgi:hypothetical protein
VLGLKLAATISTLTAVTTVRVRVRAKEDLGERGGEREWAKEDLGERGGEREWVSERGRERECERERM